MTPTDAAIAVAPQPDFHPLGAPNAPSSALQSALRHAARAGAGQAALRVRLREGPEAAPRLVRQLLEDAGRGQAVFALGPLDLLLPEASAKGVAEARAAIEALLPGAAAPEVTQWTLPGDGGALLALAGEVHAMPAPGPPTPVIAARGLDALADAVPLSAVVRRRPVLALGAPGQLLAGPLRLGLRHAALAAAMGPFGQDADLLRHARDRIARRLLAALAEDGSRRALLGGEAPRRLIVELAPDALPTRGRAAEDVVENSQDAPGGAGMLAALPLLMAARPALLERRRAALAAHGWGLALRGLTAATLTAIAAEQLAADMLLLRWSPELAARASASVIRRLDPTRIILLGCDEEEALRWALPQGIRLYGGTHPELILAAARMAACPQRAQCTRRQCLNRAAATGEDGREGCTNRPLLAATLPEAAQAA